MLPHLPILFKPDDKGKVREWSIDIEGASIFVSHGVQGGKIQTKETKVAGKNLGRSNETTPEAQAEKVALAKWAHQKDRKGYALTPEDAVLARMPMLANSFTKYSHRIEYPCGVQAKLDGLRVLATKTAEGVVRLTSRTGKAFGANLSHIEEAVDAVLTVGSVLDGELYNHDMELEDIQSAAQKTSEATASLEMWVFDVADTSVDNGARAGAMAMGFKPELPLRLVKTELVQNEAEVRKKHDLFVSAGFEGCMVRNRKGMYKFNRRSTDLLKLKAFLDKEYRVLDIEEDKDGNPLFVCIEGDNTFRTTIDGDREENMKYLRDKGQYVGKWLNVQYQKVYRKTGLPQFAKGKYFRELGEAGNPLY
jgi:DNA ligase-1